MMQERRTIVLLLSSQPPDTHRWCPSRLVSLVVSLLQRVVPQVNPPNKRGRVAATCLPGVQACPIKTRRATSGPCRCIGGIMPSCASRLQRQRSWRQKGPAMA
jgi:hypothetical protein